jgi:acetyl esterase
MNTIPTLDPKARAVLDMLAASGLPTLDSLAPPAARALFAQAVQMLRGPSPAVGEVRDLLADGPHGPIALRLYRPANEAVHAPLPGLVYFHGGGWVLGDLEVYDAFCRGVCAGSRCTVASIDYRLAPEHKFPAAVDDAFAATCWIASHARELGIDAARLGVGGDSAGANLAAVVTLLARDAGGPALKHQLLLCPVTDTRMQTASYAELADGYFLTRSLMRYFIDHYLRSAADRTDWRSSPTLAADHRGLPGATILVCGYDPLRDEGLAYARQIQDAGGKVSLLRCDDQIHDFTLMNAAIPAADAALDSVCSALRAGLLA